MPDVCAGRVAAGTHVRLMVGRQINASPARASHESQLKELHENLAGLFESRQVRRGGTAILLRPPHERILRHILKMGRASK